MDKRLKYQGKQYTPLQLARLLYRSVLTEDEVLELLKGVGDDMGYTRQLNRVGALYMAMVARDEKSEVA